MHSLTERLESPSGIALAYFLVGVSWIVVTDYLVLGMVDDQQTVTRLQTVKGWIFVGGSAALVYGLVWHSSRAQQRTNDRLERALQQTSILHRVLRHNLRNNCNVIQGHVEMLADDDAVPTSARGRLAEINDQTEELVELGAKTRYLRDAVLEDDDPVRELDLPALVEAVLEQTRARYPDATIESDLPETCRVRTTPRLERALIELVENAVEHAERDEPSVRITVHTAEGDCTEIAVADDGPGIPEIERSVLEGGTESPLVHSDGLGLWIAHTIVVRGGGTIRIADDDPRGTVVRITLQG